MGYGGYRGMENLKLKAKNMTVEELGAFNKKVKAAGGYNGLNAEDKALFDAIKEDFLNELNDNKEEEARVAEKTWRIIECYFSHEDAESVPTYTLEGVNKDDKTTKGTEYFNLTKLYTMCMEHKITIENAELLQGGFDILREKQAINFKEKFEAWNKFCAKSNLLGLPYSDIRYTKNGIFEEYTLFELVPDENGVATVPDFVTAIDNDCSDRNKKYRYKKLIWRNPLVFGMNHLFRGNDKIVKMDLSECNLSRLASLKEMFSSCDKLQEVDFGDNNLCTVGSLDKMFYSCHKLKAIKISNGNIPGCCSVSQFLDFCTSLEIVDLGKSKIYTESLGKGKHYRNGQCLAEYGTGDESVTGVCKIAMGATSFDHILSWMSRHGDNAETVRVIRLNELTGANYLYDFVDAASVKKMAPTKLVKFLTPENMDNQKSKFKQVLNKNVAVKMVYQNDYENAEAVGYCRIGLLRDLTSDEISTLKSIETAKELGKYKIVLQTEDAKPGKGLFVIYFNKFSGWKEF